MKVTDSMVAAASSIVPELTAETVRAILERGLAPDVTSVPPLPWVVETSVAGRGKNRTHCYSVVGANGEQVAMWFADTEEECIRFEARARFFIEAGELMLLNRTVRA